MLVRHGRVEAPRGHNARNIGEQPVAHDSCESTRIGPMVPSKAGVGCKGRAGAVGLLRGCWASMSRAERMTPATNPTAEPKRSAFGVARRVLEADAATNVIAADTAHFRRGLELFSARPDKEWSRGRFLGRTQRRRIA